MRRESKTVALGKLFNEEIIKKIDVKKKSPGKFCPGAKLFDRET